MVYQLTRILSLLVNIFNLLVKGLPADSLLVNDLLANGLPVNQNFVLTQPDILDLLA
jgi:hypothetical protein